MSKRLRILVVNHNRILRAGISDLIAMQPDFELVDSIAAADDAVDRFTATRPDLTLMDLDLPADSGLDSICRMRQADPSAWIIGLATDEGDDRCVRALGAGVSALLAKEQIGAMLISLIHMGRSREALELNESATEGLSWSEIKRV
jgi:DNA-binding NarL/FixJ family response regulator